MATLAHGRALNQAGLAAGKYDEIVFFCPNPRETDDTRARAIRKVLSETLGVTVSFCVTEESSVYETAHAILSASDGSECEIDLSGADGVFAAASGYAMRGNGGIRLLLPESESGAPTYPFSFRDTVAMNGSAVISVADGENYRFDDGSLRSEILRLWEATREIPADWNRFCSLAWEDYTDEHKHARIHRKIKKESDRVICERVMAHLKKKKIVYEYAFSTEKGTGELTYELYRSAKTKSLYIKSGTALEMFVCLASSECASLRDCLTSVILDLDGRITRLPNDPKNELDVTAMYGTRPVFVSCKNTVPTKEFLYEIKEMADRFGGGEGIPVLVSTAHALGATRERAEQMGVFLLDDVSAMNLNQLKEKLASLLP